MANSQPSNNMPLNAFGDPVEQEVNAFGDPVEPHPGEIQKLNRTELAKLPQFQPEKISMLDKMAGPLADYVVGPIANIPNTIRGVAAEGMNLPFRVARAMGLYPESQQRMRISPDQFDENGNVVPGSISQSNVPVSLPYNANYAPHIPFNPTPIQPTEPEGQALVNKVLGMATPDVILGGLTQVNPRTLAAFFAPQMIAQAPQVVQHGAEQVMNPTLSGRERVGAAGTTLADLAMAALVTHGAMPEAKVPSGIAPSDISDLIYSRVPEERQLNEPTSEVPKALLPRFAQSETTGMTQPSSGQPMQLPQLTGEPRFAASPAGQLADLSQFTELEKLALLRKTMQPTEAKGQYQPIADLRQPSVEQPIINPNDTKSLQQPNIVSAYQPIGEPKQGGQISFEGSAGGIPNALQQHQPSLARMLEDAIKKNQIEKSDLTRSEGGGEKILAQQTSKETSLPTTSDFEQYSELRQQAKGFSAKGEFPPSELLRQMEEIKNRNKGMPPKEETTVPLNERLKARLKAFNDAQAKRIQSGDSMGRIAAGLAPKSGGIGTGMKKAIEGNQEAGSVSLQGFKDLGDATKKAIKGLSVDFQVFKDSFNRASEFRDVVMKNQAIEGGALTTATRAENHVNLEATRIFGKDSEIARNAAIAVLESKRDKTMLPTFLKQAAKNKEAIEGIKFAQANWNKLQPLADAIEAVDMFNRSTAKAAGVEIPYLSDYLKRAYERDTGWLTRPKVQPGTGMSSRLKRQYDSIYEAIEDGHSPVSFDSAALVGKRTREIFNEVNQHLWVEHLKNTKDSVTGEPILTDITGKGKVRLPPEGYVKVELPSGKSLGVLEGYDRLIKALTGESDIANSLAGRVLLETQQGIKHSTLAFDFFHLSRVAMFRKSFALKNMYKKGLSILEFSDADLNEAKNQGLIDQATVDYSRGKVDTSFGPISRREVVSLGIKNGLGVGRHSEALYTSFIRSIPLVGDLNRFIFDKFTRGAIAESFVNKFSEQSKYHPTMSKAAVAQMVARDINFRMGNIQKQGIFKSATMQDLLRIPLLAPSWVESMAQSEARSVGQVGKALLPGKNFMKPGVLGKSTAALVASFVVGTQVINMLSKGQPTWKNGDGHQLDAWVPPVTKNGKGFWISPLSVAAEITHDLLRFSRKGSAVDASARIAENKLSPLGQGAKLFITGQDWKGEEHHGGDRLWSAIAAAFNPMPLIGKQAIASVQSKDVAPLERQAFALGGVKAEPESYNEQKQRIIDNMKSGKSMTLFERKQLEEQLKSLRQTPSDAAKVAITTRATEQMLERKNGLRDELPDDIKSWLKHENLDITGFANAFGYRKTRIGLTQDEADRYKEIVKDAYVQFLSAHVGQQMTQQKLDGVLIKAKNYARKQMKGEMQQ